MSETASLYREPAIGREISTAQLPGQVMFPVALALGFVAIVNVFVSLLNVFSGR